MNLSKKLPACFAAVSMAVACAGLFGIWELNNSVNTYKGAVASYSHAQEVETIVSTFKTQVQEWKNTLLRGKDSDNRAKYWQAFQESESRVAHSVVELSAKLAPGDERKLLDDFAAAHAKMGEGYRKAYADFEASGFDASVGDSAVKGQDRAPTELLLEARKKIVTVAQDNSQVATKNSERAINISLLAMLLGLISAVIGGVVMSRSIVRPLKSAVTVAQAVASGDLRGQITVTSSDETGQLLRALHDMTESLRKIVTDVRDGSQTIAVASSQIAQGNHELSVRTEKQAASLEETSASTEELASTVNKNNENVGQADKLSVNATVLAEKGGSEINKAVQTMTSINEASKKMSDIIGVIDSIAFQTNILALNAAVEAARAGEQGRGFAVVASEVRTLAQRSASAAKDIKALIIDSVARIEEGSESVNNVGATMDLIITSVHSVMTSISEISTATKEQQHGVDQINIAMLDIDAITQQNAALVEEASAAAYSLREQTEALNRTVSVFKVN